MKELLKNPKLVYEYQKNLAFTKIQLQKDQTHIAQIEKLLNAIPNKKEKLLVQHKNGWKSDAEVGEAMEVIKAEKIGYEKKIREIQDRISKNTLSEGYIKTFEIFAEKYSTILDDISRNREEIVKVLRMIIDSIIVTTRPATDDDRIA